MFNSQNGLVYITKENYYEYSIDVFHIEFLKSNIPIKHLYDKIANNPSKALAYMLESDIIYLIENGIIIDKIIITEEEDFRLNI